MEWNHPRVKSLASQRQTPNTRQMKAVTPLLPRGKESGQILSPPPVLRGRARVGAAGEFSIDGRLHRFWMPQDVIVREADNPDTMAEQCLAALLVILYALLVIVLATVGLEWIKGDAAARSRPYPAILM